MGANLNCMQRSKGQVRKGKENIYHFSSFNAEQTRQTQFNKSERSILQECQEKEEETRKNNKTKYMNIIKSVEDLERIEMDAILQKIKHRRQRQDFMKKLVKNKRIQEIVQEYKEKGDLDISYDYWKKNQKGH